MSRKWSAALALAARREPEVSIGDILRRDADSRRSVQAPRADDEGAVALEVIERVAGCFDAVPLDRLGAAALMDRVDTKFVLPVQIVPEVLRLCTSYYWILDVDGRRLSRYRTVYYDTADLAFYHAHHAGRAPRRKVRVRTYVDTDQHYLEVKLRTNKGRTVKSRLRLECDPVRAPDHLGVRPHFMAFPAAPEDLREVVTVDYTRLTLVSRDATERVTLDMAIEFSTDGRRAVYPSIAIAEVKQRRRSRSRFFEATRALGLREGGLSKYCLGVASLYEGVKINRFKSVLRHIHRMSGDDFLPTSAATRLQQR